MSPRNDLIAHRAVRYLRARHHTITLAIALDWEAHEAAVQDSVDALNELKTACGDLPGNPLTDRDIPTLSLGEIDTIHHALGHDFGRPRRGGFRNRYIVCGKDLTPPLQRLVDLELMSCRRQRPGMGDGWCLRVTEAGAIAAGCLPSYRRWERSEKAEARDFVTTKHPAPPSS